MATQRVFFPFSLTSLLKVLYWVISPLWLYLYAALVVKIQEYEEIKFLLLSLLASHRCGQGCCSFRPPHLCACGQLLLVHLQIPCVPKWASGGPYMPKWASMWCHINENCVCCHHWSLTGSLLSHLRTIVSGNRRWVRVQNKIFAVSWGGTPGPSDW